MAKPRKVRADFRKNRSVRRRPGDLTRALRAHPDALESESVGERISGKGELTRRRTVRAAEPLDASVDGMPMASNASTWQGRVLHVHGRDTFVTAPDGSTVRCTTRRLLHSLSTDQRHPVAAGDQVRVRDDAAGGVSGSGMAAGVIEAVEPRRNSLSRESRGRRHVLVANVDQVVIVGSAACPGLKPALVDRLLVAAESADIRPLICINKADLVNPAALVPYAGVYARMGYPVILCSAATGMGIDRLAAELPGRVTAVVGQSGVGKSSLLNALDPTLGLMVAEVSRENDKGRHTTTTARLVPHRHGGMFVDTPGVRQFALWQFVAAEASNAFRDLRPLANLCRFPDCTHAHEADCAVKHAVADGLLDTRRWESCLALTHGDDARAATAGDGTDEGSYDDPSSATEEAP
jgi:ribosome biogenesis GTPase